MEITINNTLVVHIKQPTQDFLDRLDDIRNKK